MIKHLYLRRETNLFSRMINIVNKIKVQKSALKLFVVLSGIGFTLYCGILCMGVRHAVAEFVAMTMGYVMIGITAWMYRLCWLSWAFIIYSYLIRCCIIVHRIGWFGVYINVAHLIAFAIGLILCYFLLKDINKYKKSLYEDC